jgi:hypothetical protein
VKARILQDNVIVHLSTDEISPEVQRLSQGAEVELGRVLTNQGVQWVELLEGSFVKGFIRGDTRVYFIKKIVVDQDEVIVYDMAAPTALEKARYIKGTVLYALDDTKVAEQDWLQVRDENGNVGFIHKDTKLKADEPAAAPPPQQPQPGTAYPGTPFVQTPEMREAIRLKERNSGRNMMIIGVVMFIAGCAVTALSYSAASSSSSGGYYWLCFGPIIFGPVYFFQGLAKYNRNK